MILYCCQVVAQAIIMYLSIHRLQIYLRCKLPPKKGPALEVDAGLVLSSTAALRKLGSVLHLVSQQVPGKREADEVLAIPTPFIAFTRRLKSQNQVFSGKFNALSRSSH
jgi:hypothetical protein